MSREISGREGGKIRGTSSRGRRDRCDWWEERRIRRWREDISDGWEEGSRGKEEKIKGNKMRRDDN